MFRFVSLERLEQEKELLKNKYRLAFNLNAIDFNFIMNSSLEDYYVLVSCWNEYVDDIEKEQRKGEG